MIERIADEGIVEVVCDGCGMALTVDAPVDTDADIEFPPDDDCEHYAMMQGWIKFGDDPPIYCVNCSQIDPYTIKDAVKKGLDWHLSSYSFNDLIDNTNLTRPQKEWAKRNLYPMVGGPDHV
jgi:hypothetical protein